MSFLNSVLNSIDGSTAPARVSGPQRSSSAAKKPETLSVNLSSKSKRKAEDDLRGSNVKIAKTSTATSSKPATAHDRPAKFPQSFKPKVNGPPQSLKTKPSESPTTYKDTGRPDSIASAPADSKNAPPKKGSYAEVLARAKQNKGPPVGSITHKPKEKMSAKKEMALEKELAKKKTARGVQGLDIQSSKAGGSSIMKGLPHGKAADRSVKSGAYQGTSRPIHKSQPSSGYAGTAKSKPQTSYQGTMKPSMAATSLRQGPGSDLDVVHSKPESSSKHHHREEDYDDDSEGYGSEDPYSYDSDDYSDMDAGFEDMEEEDEMAERHARREDAKEQAQLDKLKREKEKKKALHAQGTRGGR